MKNKLKTLIGTSLMLIITSDLYAQSAQSVFDRARTSTPPQQTPAPKKPAEPNEPPKINDQLADGTGPTELSAGFTTGTGFFVDEAGHLITAAHVVANCIPTSIKIRGFDKNIIPAKRLTVDTRNDLALLRIDNKGTKYLPLNLTPQLGEDVYAFGYPLFGELAQSGNFTAGIVTSLSGFKEDTTRFQISAAIQSGNSGGPVFDQKGNVIGIVLSRLTSRTDAVQNVNFALRSRLVEIFLSSNGINPVFSKDTDQNLSKTEIAMRGQSSAVLVGCEIPPPKKKEGEK